MHLNRMVMKNLEIHTIVVGLLETNCYLIEDPAQRRAMCIDPGGDAEKILLFCKKKQLVIDRILLTHGHYDHIGAVNALVDMLDIQAWIHPDDVEMACSPTLNLSSMITAPYQIDSYIQYFEVGEPVNFGEQKISILHTPGHTPGSVCFYWDHQLISGDTIFRNSIGRTDFPKADPEQLIESIELKLMPLDDNVRIFPGHGMTTTIGHEREKNPFLARNNSIF
ncbi:MBL fold metallo-hydrolase [bacterium]|nr:MBL fold metallo-hydrolase [bacterium]